MSEKIFAGLCVILIGFVVAMLGIAFRLRAIARGGELGRGNALMLLGAAFATGGLFALLRP